MGDVRNKIRNTARFLLGNLHDFNPAENSVPYEQLPELDRYMLHRMREVFAEVTEAYESFQFFRVFQMVQNFCVVDLSNFYLDVAKDRLYISDSNASRRRSCQTVMSIVLENLARVIAPILPHLAEDIWQFLPYTKPKKLQSEEEAESVFESGWVKLEEKWQKPELAEFWQKLLKIRTDVNKWLEQYRIGKLIGSSLEAKVLVYVSDLELRQRLQALNPVGELSSNGVDELRYLFLVSQVELLKSTSDIKNTDLRRDVEVTLSMFPDTSVTSIEIDKADGEKCERCWNYSIHVGASQERRLLCERCIPALAGQF